MADVCITIPDDQVTRVVDAFCDHYQFDRKALPGETRTQFARRMHDRLVRTFVRSTEARIAANTARDDILRNPSDPLG